MEALLAFDLELARAPTVASNALVGEIRLTWWREALDEIFAAGPPRRHPVAEALAGVVGRHGLARADLEALIDARYVELDRRPLSEDEALAWASATGGGVAALTSLILDPASDAEAARLAGRAWSLAQAARAGLAGPGWAKAAIGDALTELRAQRSAVSVQAFPAVAPAALARREAAGADLSDLERRGRLLWASLRGRV